jgi:hypothetical protein
MNNNLDSLTRLATQLREEDYRVSIEADALTVNLPLGSSVSARIESGGLALSAMFGQLSRAFASFLTFGVTVLFMFLFGDSILPLGTGTLIFAFIVGAILWDVRRWLLTQKVMARIKELGANLDCA